MILARSFQAHKRRLAILRYLAHRERETAIPPRLTELMGAAGITSLSVGEYHVDALRHKEYMEPAPVGRRMRYYQLTPQGRMLARADEVPPRKSWPLSAFVSDAYIDRAGQLVFKIES